MSLEGHLDVTTNGDAEFSFTVTNGDTEPVELTFRSGLIVDFAVFDNSEEIWRWSDGQMFTQALVTETLAPGESFVESGTWTDPPPGTYTVRASLNAVDTDLEASTEFGV